MLNSLYTTINKRFMEMKNPVIISMYERYFQKGYFYISIQDIKWKPQTTDIITALLNTVAGIVQLILIVYFLFLYIFCYGAIEACIGITEGIIGTSILKLKNGFFNIIQKILEPLKNILFKTFPKLQNSELQNKIRIISNGGKYTFKGMMSVFSELTGAESLALGIEQFGAISRNDQEDFNNSEGWIRKLAKEYNCTFLYDAASIYLLFGAMASMASFAGKMVEYDEIAKRVKWKGLKGYKYSETVKDFDFKKYENLPEVKKQTNSRNKLKKALELYQEEISGVKNKLVGTTILKQQYGVKLISEVTGETILFPVAVDGINMGESYTLQIPEENYQLLQMQRRQIINKLEMLLKKM